MTSSAAQCKHKEERKQQLLHNRKMFAVISLLLVITFGIWCYWRWETSKFVAQFELIPGPPRKWPLLGNILDFPRSGHGKLLCRILKFEFHLLQISVSISTFTNNACRMGQRVRTRLPNMAWNPANSDALIPRSY